MGFVAPLHVSMADGAAGKPDSAAGHRHLAQIERLSGATNPSAHHHGTDLWPAQKAMGGQFRQQQAHTGGYSAGEQAHPGLAVFRFDGDHLVSDIL